MNNLKFKLITNLHVWTKKTSFINCYIREKTIYYTKLVLTPQTLLFGVSVILFIY